MHPTLKCKNCSTENPFYQLTCIKCSAYLRERIFNIDLWDTIIKLIESPMSAYTRIIHAEHKNFIIFIWFFAAIKLSISSVYLSLALRGNNHYIESILLLFGITSGILFSTIAVCSFLLKIFLKTKEVKTRFRDNLALITYSLFPYIFALIILFPIELILFGYTVFSVNPHPFIIKPLLAWVMLSFEVMVILWGIFLSFMAFKRQSGNTIISILFTLIFNGIIFILLFYTAGYIYTL